MRNYVQVEKRCPFCGRTYQIEVPYLGLLAWQGGEHIQRAMPEVPVATRESLMSGLCQQCQEQVFGEDEDFPELYEE